MQQEHQDSSINLAFVKYCHVLVRRSEYMRSLWEVLRTLHAGLSTGIAIGDFCEKVPDYGAYEQDGNSLRSGYQAVSANRINIQHSTS
ncbi:hypothetical protein GGI43DRAFT_239883 [Trichoderma evansii]